MPIALVVTQPFGDRQIGDLIDDKDAIKDVLAGENAQRVVRVNVDAQPKDAA